VKLYISTEQQLALRALCVSSPVSARRVSPPSVSALWQESAVRGAFAGVAVSPIPTVASAPAVAPIASFAVTGGVAALGGVEVPGGVEVQGGMATGVFMDVDRVGTSTTQHVRTVEQISAVTGVALLDRRGVQVQGTSGLTANDKHDLTAPKPNGGVRGIPPRGRPV
jgi:hypothetical protein